MSQSKQPRPKRATPCARLGALALFATLYGALSGCAADATDTESSRTADDRPHLPAEILASLSAERQENDKPLTNKERARVLEILRTRGHDVSTALFYAEDVVRIEGDLLFYGPKVLRDSSSETKKGKWFGPGGDPAYRYNVLGDNLVRISWAAQAPDFGWLFAFAEARQDFEQNTNVKFTWDTNASVHSTVVIHQVYSDDPNSKGFVASTFPGHDIDNPSPIFLNMSFDGSISAPGPCHVPSTYDLPYDVKRRVARHEMAHTLGYAHSESAFPTISGTAEGIYPTVMEGQCTDTPTALTWDDIHMINTVYYLPPL